MSAHRNRVLRAFEWFAKFERRFILSIATVMLIAATVIMLGEGIGRTFFETSFFWAEESVRYLVLCAFFLTLGCAGHAGRHIRTDLVVERFPPGVRRGLGGLVCLLGLASCAILIYASVPQIERYYSLGMTTNSSLDLPMWALFTVLPVGAVLWAIYYLHALCRALSGLDPFADCHSELESWAAVPAEKADGDRQTQVQAP